LFFPSTFIPHASAGVFPFSPSVWEGLIPIRAIMELQPLFNGGAERTAEITNWLDQIIERKGFGAEQLREALRPRLAELRQKQIEAAQEVIKEVAPIPEKVKLETPEDFEEAAKTLRREAKRRKTPEQLEEEKQEKVNRTLSNGKSSVASRIEKAKESAASDVYKRQFYGRESKSRDKR